MSILPVKPRCRCGNPAGARLDHGRRAKLSEKMLEAHEAGDRETLERAHALLEALLTIPPSDVCTMCASRLPLIGQVDVETAILFAEVDEFVGDLESHAVTLAAIKEYEDRVADLVQVLGQAEEQGSL